MSSYGDLFEKPTIVSQDGAADYTTTQELADNTETAFNTLEEVIGNLHGLTTEDGESNPKSTSIAGELGDIQGFSPELPFNVEFSDYVQTFNDQTTKEFTLDLIAEFTVEPIIVSSSDTGVVWTRVSSHSDLAAIGDYSIDGKSLMFYKQPSGQFTITYTGTYISNEGGLEDGYMPNIYPSPELIAADASTKPVIAQVSTTRYSLTFTQSSQNNNLEDFGADLVLTFSSLIQPFVSSTSYVSVPQDYVALWILTADDYYEKLSCDDIYIRSETLIEFDTTETIDIANDTIILALANVSISDAITSLIKMAINHKHDRYGSSALIDHASLSGRIPVSSSSDIYYSESSINGNDHPQYLLREGYQTDSGNYNNAMLGDLLIGSTDSSSEYNNITADSNKIVFGSISNGNSIRYSIDFLGLEISGEASGLKINAGDKDSTQTYPIISLNENEFFEYTVSGSTYLNFGSESGLFRFSSNTATDLATVTMGTLIATKVDVEDGATIDFGNISLENISDNLVISDISGTSSGSISITAPVTIAKGTLTDIVADTITVNTSIDISTDAEIIFGDATSGNKISAQTLTDTIFDTAVSEDVVVIETDYPVSFKSSGKDSGLRFGYDESRPVYYSYGALYSASATGAASVPSQSDLYIESYTGGVYFLQTTQQTIIDSDRAYTWASGSTDERIDSLQEWPRADIFASEASFKNIIVEASDLTNKLGISFGNSNSIYLTGSGGDCPAGWLVIESQNGVVLVDSASEVIDCSTMNYSDLTIGNLQTFGSILTEESITATGDITTSGELSADSMTIENDTIMNGDSRVRGTLTLENDLVSLGGGTFNTDVSVSGSITAGNLVKTNSLEVSGSATFSNIAEFESTITADSDLLVSGQVQIKGETIMQGDCTANIMDISEGNISTLTVSSELTVKTSASFGGNVDVTGTLNVEQSIISDSAIVSSGDLSGADLDIDDTASIGGDATFGSDVTIKGDLFLNSSSSKLVAVGSAQFSGDVTLNGNLSSYGDTIFSGTMTANSSVQLNSSLNVKGVVEFDASLEVGGALTTEYLTVTSTTTLGGFVIVEDKLQGEDADFSGNVRIEGDLSTSSISLQDGIETGISSQSTFGSIEVAGVFEQTSATADFIVSGYAAFSNTVSFASDLTVNASVDIANTLVVGSTNQITLSDNTIEVGGSANRGRIFAGAIDIEAATCSGEITTDSITTDGITVGSDGMIVNGDSDFNGYRIKNVTDPVDPQDPVTLAYLSSYSGDADEVSLTQNGYIEFASSGLIMQWGRISAVANGTTVVSFPMQFPNACFSVTGSAVGEAGTNSQDNFPTVRSGTITQTGFSMFNADDNDAETCWIAIGF